MSFYVVDVESDGPIPGKYSMVCFGAVKVDDALDKTFYGRTAPISDIWQDGALAISGFTREEHMGFSDPLDTLKQFEEFVRLTNKGDKATMISDNISYDWMFMAWYLHTFLGRNIFGYSGRRMGDMYCGMQKDAYTKWKHLRKTNHDHNPVNDAIGNAEALLAMRDMGLKINLK